MKRHRICHDSQNKIPILILHVPSKPLEEYSVFIYDSCPKRNFYSRQIGNTIIFS